MRRSIVRSLAGFACCVFPLHPVQADTLFRLTETVSEQEVRPHVAKHVVRWQGDYYVADSGVSVSGWATKHASKLIPYDQPHAGTSIAGSPFTSTFHRVADGVDVRVEYESFVMERHIVQTGPQSCSEQVSLWLKPGHTLFEVHRTSNHELMFETTRTYTVTRCEFPPLTS